MSAIINRSRTPGHSAGLNFALGTGGAVVAGALQYAVALIIARRLGPASFGRYAFLLSTSYLIALVTDCGLSGHLVRVVAERVPAARAALGSALRVKVPLTALSLLVCIAVVVAAGGGWELRWGLVVIWLAQVAGLLVNAFTGCFRGLRRMDLELVAAVIQSLVLLAAVLSAFAAGGGLVACCAAWLAGYAAALLFCGTAARKLLPPAAEGGSLREGLRMVVRALPLAAGSLGVLARTHLPVILLRRWVPIGALGSFAAAHSLIKYGEVVGAVAVGAFVPWLVDPASRRRRAIRLLLIALAAGLAAAAAVSWLAYPAVLALYGQRFRDSAALLRVMAPLPILFALDSVTIAWLMARGRYRAVAFGNCLGAAALVLALWYLGPKEGIYGGAAAVVTAHTTSTGALGFCCLLALRRRPGPGAPAQPSAS